MSVSNSFSLVFLLFSQVVCSRTADTDTLLPPGRHKTRRGDGGGRRIPQTFSGRRHAPSSSFGPWRLRPSVAAHSNCTHAFGQHLASRPADSHKQHRRQTHLKCTEQHHTSVPWRLERDDAIASLRSVLSSLPTRELSGGGPGQREVGKGGRGERLRVSTGESIVLHRCASPSAHLKKKSSAARS